LCDVTCALPQQPEPGAILQCNPQTVSCSKPAYPCSIIWPATHACPASTSAPWPTYLGAPPSFHPSAATIAQKYHTASGTIRARLGNASSDTQSNRGNGSHLYEVNIWMCRYGRGRARMVSRGSGLSVSARAGSGPVMSER
jgi:hypothetical protein